MNTGIEKAQKKDAGEAGHCGPNVRSDVRVSIEARQSGRIDLELESRVKPYYGDAIRRQAGEVLEALGVRHARVVIQDEGALPFVIAARIESAARRAGLGEGIRFCQTGCRLPSLPHAIACGVRDSMFLAVSLSVSSTRRCTEQMP